MKQNKTKYANTPGRQTDKRVNEAMDGNQKLQQNVNSNTTERIGALEMKNELLHVVVRTS